MHIGHSQLLLDSDGVLICVNRVDQIPNDQSFSQTLCNTSMCHCCLYSLSVQKEKTTIFFLSFFF